MLIQFILGVFILSASVALQSGMVAALLQYVRHADAALAQFSAPVRASLIVGLASFWLMIVHGVAIAAWAIAFRMLDVFPDIETATYFSAVAFTTLGFGDVIPPHDWRQLAGICAAHGLLVFGVSSAALVETFRRIVERED